MTARLMLKPEDRMSAGDLQVKPGGVDPEAKFAVAPQQAVSLRSSCLRATSQPACTRWRLSRRAA
jgi:hypothetical protein